VCHAIWRSDASPRWRIWVSVSVRVFLIAVVSAAATTAELAAGSCRDRDYGWVCEQQFLQALNAGATVQKMHVHVSAEKSGVLWEGIYPVLAHG
jgi:hypothetical protein